MAFDEEINYVNFFLTHHRSSFSFVNFDKKFIICTLSSFLMRLDLNSIHKEDIILKSKIFSSGVR